ncbi:MAG: MBL fold metallo-hydrolase [Porticoccaceae bacterium]
MFKNKNLLTIICWLLIAPFTCAEPSIAADFKPAQLDSHGRFENNPKIEKNAPLAVTLPFFARRFATNFRSGDGAPAHTPNDGVALRANTGTPTVTWVGHSTLFVQIEGVNFLTDPIWSNTPSPVPFLGPSRWVAAGIAIADLPSIDFVVISHNHYDHLDLPTLKILAQRNPQTQFLVPLGNRQLLEKNGINQVHEFNWGDQIKIKGITVHCLPAQHWSKRGIADTRKTLWASWAVIGEQRRFYFSGDTGYFEGFKYIGDKLGPFDLAAVPIGAYEPRAMMRTSHTNPEEALQAAVDLRANKAIGIHFGTFDLSDEALEEPPQRFKAAALESTLGIKNAWIFNVGETRSF